MPLDVSQVASFPLAGVFDYFLSGGAPLAFAEVTVTPNYEEATLTGTVLRVPMVRQRALTDAAGYVSFWLAPVDVLLPANIVYIVRGPGMRAFRIKPVSPTLVASSDPAAMLIPSGPSQGLYAQGQQMSAITRRITAVNIPSSG